MLTSPCERHIGVFYTIKVVVCPCQWGIFVARCALRARRSDRFGHGASRTDVLASPKPQERALRARTGTRIELAKSGTANPRMTAVRPFRARAQGLARAWKAHPMGHLWAPQHPLSSTHWVRTCEIVSFWHVNPNRVRT